jgi:CheY-like chemotaxis protein
VAIILVADDVKSMRRLLRLSLSEHHTVIEAADGTEALELLRQHRPDAAVLDVGMPMLSGLQVCQRLRADPDLRDIRVIIISATSTDADARQAGADRFLAKPFRLRALRAAVDELVQNRVLGRTSV